jgi:hypothetical protein
MGWFQTQFIPKLFADGNWKRIDRSFLFTSKLTSNDTLSTIRIADATLGMFFFSSQIVKLRLDIETTSGNGHHSIKSR